MEFVYIDLSNFFIVGQQMSVIRRGMAPDLQTARELRIVDYDYRLNFGAAYQILCGAREDVKRAAVFGSSTAMTSDMFTMVAASGFEVVTVPRNASNREKQIDTGLVTRVMADAYKHCQKAGDTITLVAGDGDYVPVVRELVEDGFSVDVCFWSHCSNELANCASRFVNLDKYFDYLSTRARA